MKSKFILDNITLLKILLFLQVINYMVGVIILRDNVFFKFSRDIILMYLVISMISKGIIKINRELLLYLVFIAFLLVAFIHTIGSGENVSLVFNVLRRYLYPVLVLFVVSRLSNLNKECIVNIIWWILVFLSISSLWGVFQAWVLKDDFLISLGYPVVFLQSYGTMMLGYSFYFGGLGIQRVVSTFSNSNVCGLVYGMALIMSIYMYPFLTTKNRVKKNIVFLCLTIGYALTFSRSNFLAAAIVLLFIVYRYIPFKRELLIIVLLAVSIVIVMFFVQESSGLIYKIGGWIISSFRGTESSAAGRKGIWVTAFKAIINNPLGVGFGKVGALASKGNSGLIYATENSYMAVALDIGILGGLIYIVCLYSLYSKMKLAMLRNSRICDLFSERLCKSGYTILVYFMVVSFFSNHIYDMDVMIFMYVYIGMVLNLIRSQCR